MALVDSSIHSLLFITLNLFLDSVLLNAMDRHISENIYKKDYQPKIGFVEFSTANIEILKASITKICYKGVTDIKIIQEKIKKT